MFRPCFFRQRLFHSQEADMQKGIWENEEVLSLFERVEKAKKSGRPLKDAFLEHAKKYARQPNSVRNYYYHEVDNLKNDEKRRKLLKVNLDKHKKSAIEYFTPEEEKQLMAKIENMVQKGCSVRKACFTLANGDVGQMLRFQNKYRNFLSKKGQTEKPSNIIKFTNKKKDILSESDLNSLFIGLVRLVKRSALEEVNDKYRIEKENANAKLRQVLAELSKKEEDLDSLKKSFRKLKEENIALMRSATKSDKTKCLSQKLGKQAEKMTESPTG